jgi:MATE family multidrug resistance protein
MTKKISLKAHYYNKGGIQEMLIIALPMVVSYACDVVMQITDRLFMAEIAPEAMNAVLGGGLSVLVLSFFFVGVLSFTTSLVAHYYGAGLKINSAKVLTQAFILVLIAYPLILLLRPLGLLFFQFMKVTPEQLVYQVQYFNIMVYGILFSLLRTAFTGYFSGIGNTHTVMIATSVTMVANVGLNYVLVFGKLGFPTMGIQGVAIGTVMASALGTIVFIWRYFSAKNAIEFEVKKSFRFDWRIMKKLLYYGTPQGTEMFVNMLAFNVLVFIFQSQGNIIATATTITFNWDYISFIPLIGIEIAIMSLVGKYMGAKDVKSAVRSTFSGLKAGLLYSLVCLILFVWVPEPLVYMFKGNTDDAMFHQIAPLAIQMLQLASLYVLFDAIMVCLVGALRGAGDTYWTMWASITAHWSMAIVAYIMFEFFGYHVISVWLAVIVVIIVFAMVLLHRFFQGKWKKINVLK